MEVITLKLKDIIGESSQYEKKEKLERNKPKSWLKSVSAFANTSGGTIVFGLSDDDELIGLDNYKEDSGLISEMLKAKMDPIPGIQLENIMENGKYFIILKIEEGSETPYYVLDGGNKTAYIRVGNQSVSASVMDLKNLVLKGINQTFDTLPTKNKIEDTTFNKLRIEYNRRTNKEFISTDLVSFGLATNDRRLTYAGALFSDDYLVYQSRIFCTRWNGLTMTSGRMEALDDKEFEGNLLFLLENALNFVKVNTKKMWRKGPVYREEYPEYPERAVQEAIVNALIHRDYSVIGSEVHIDIYDDRLEIYSPGGMYDGTLVQNLDPFNVSSSRRNPVLADIFGRMDLMERRCSGLKKIIESYEFEKNYKEDLKPEFRSTESSFLVILKNMNYNIKDEGLNEGLNKGLNEGLNKGLNQEKNIEGIGRQENILEIIDKNPKTTVSELSEMLGVSVSTTERELSRLKNEGLIKREGSRKTGEWKIK